MWILADTNVPEGSVFAKREDGPEAIDRHDGGRLGLETTDDASIEYAETEGIAVFSTDGKDFGDRDARIAVFVAPEGMAGRDVRTTIAYLETPRSIL